MKKTRFIPYGYTMRGGHTVIQHDEADIIRQIFERYIKGASLKEISEELTQMKIPYTEKSDTWDKARIARIIDNSKYIGNGKYDPIIDRTTFTEAAATKAMRNTYRQKRDSDAILLIRNRVKCAKCGYPMVRHVNGRYTIHESWTCKNPQCGLKVRISDQELLSKINLLINRIIDNTELLIPTKQDTPAASARISALQTEINKELSLPSPSEAFIMSKLSDIAQQLYQETNEQSIIAEQITRKRAFLMKPQKYFNCSYFSDLVDTVSLGETGSVTLITKTQATIGEGDNIDGRL